MPNGCRGGTRQGSGPGASISGRIGRGNRSGGTTQPQVGEQSESATEAAAAAQGQGQGQSLDPLGRST